MLRKRLPYVLIFVSIILVTIIVFISSLFYYLYDLKYYAKEQKKYNVYQIFGEEKTIYESKNIISFFKSKNELDSGFFNPDEISHLNDVKNLINKAYMIYLLCILFVIICNAALYFINRNNMLENVSIILIYCGALILILLAVLSLIYYFVGFEFVFIKFHELFFTGNYAFDPSISNMKALFPDKFFFDISLAIFLRILATAAVSIILGFFIRLQSLKRLFAQFF